MNIIHPWEKKKEAQEAIVDLGSVSPPVADMFMNFIYTGTFGAGFIMLQEVCELSLLADRYDVAGL